jgi:quercetin dioxygenase-like cupin family protein
MAPRVYALDELRRSPTAALFEGAGDGVDASIFITTYPQGRGPDLHVHPYPEVFVVDRGVARFTVGEEEHVVEAGHVVVVPAETPHGFKCHGEDELHVISVHPSASVQQTNL